MLTKMKMKLTTVVLGMSGIVGISNPAIAQTSASTIVQPDNMKSNALSASLRIISQSYCHVDNQSFDVHMKIQVRFTNVLDRPVILSRKIDPPTVVRVAKTADEGKARKFEYAPNADRFVAENPSNPPTGDAPDPRYFIVLTHGESFDVTTFTTVVATKEDSSWQGDFVRPGVHVIQLGMSTWPYYGYDDVDELANKWAMIGSLHHGVVYTDFVNLNVPKKFKNPRCRIPQRPGAPR